MLFFSIGVTAIAQQVKWGTEIQEKNPFIQQLFETDKGVYSVYTKKAGGMFSSASAAKIHRYSSDLAFERELEFKEKGLELQQVINLDNRLYAFFEKEGDDKSRSIMGAEIDQEAMRLATTPTTLKTLKDAKGGLFSAGDEASFLLRNSVDKTKIAILGIPGVEKNSNEVFSITVLGQGLHTIWEKNVTLPYANDLFYVSDYEVDNEGNFYVLGKLYAEKAKEREKDGSNYSFILLKYNGGETPETYNIKLNGLFVAELSFDVDDRNNVRCVGFYREDYRKGNKGIFFLKVDATQKAITVQSTKDFTPELVETIAGKRAAKKDKGISLNFEGRGFVKRSDGGLIAFAELAYQVTVQNSNGGMPTGLSLTITQSTTHYYRNDVLIMNIKPDGNIEWLKALEKDQHTTNDGGYYSSFARVVDNDKLHLLFNLNEKSYTKKHETKFTSPKNSVLVSYTLDAIGNFTDKLLFNNNEDEIETIAMPQKAFQVKENEVLMITTKGKKQRLVRLTY